VLLALLALLVQRAILVTLALLALLVQRAILVHKVHKD
jgi:hypothetical protein